MKTSKLFLALSIISALIVLSISAVSASSYGYIDYRSDRYLYGNDYNYRPNYVYGNINDNSKVYNTRITYGDGYSKSYYGESYYDYRTGKDVYYTSSVVSPGYSYKSSFYNNGYRIWNDGPRYNTGFHKTSYSNSDSAYKTSYHTSVYYPVTYSRTYGYYNHRITGYY